MNYPIDEPVKRYKSIRSEMETQGIDSIIVYSTQWKYEAVHYVSNYRLLGLSSCVVLPLMNDPILFISEEWDLQRAADTSWIKDIRYFNGKDLTEVAESARKYGKTTAVVGLEIITMDQYSAISKSFGNNIVNGLSILDKVAMVKSPWEIEILRKNGRIADAGFLAEVSSIRPGIKEYELAANMEHAMKSLGADDNFQMIAAGKNLSCMHVPREKALEMGDLILSEITPIRESITYATQLCRTVKLGKATDVEKEKYNLLVEALESALSILKPGIPAKKIALIQNDIIGKQGYEKYCNPPYMRSRGHNFGLGQFELTVDNEMEILPGMAMVVHPNQFIPEVGYLACGETVIVTETGIETLSNIPAMLYEVGGVVL